VIARAQEDLYTGEKCVESLAWNGGLDRLIGWCDDRADEAELAEAKRKADPGCTYSPSPGAGTGDMLCPSCAGVYSAKFDAQLAASLDTAIELRAEDLRGEPALTVDQNKVDERYGRIAYEAFPTMGGVPHDWENLRLESRDEFIVLAKTVCAEMAKAGKLRCVCRVELGDSPCPVHVRGGS
jgi:hypothetical protein